MRRKFVHKEEGGRTKDAQKEASTGGVARCFFGFPKSLWPGRQKVSQEGVFFEASGPKKGIFS